MARLSCSETFRSGSGHCHRTPTGRAASFQDSSSGSAQAGSAVVRMASKRYARKKVEFLHDQEDARCRMRKAARTRVETEFSLDVMVRKIEAVLLS
jgi:hypothetical protein